MTGSTWRKADMAIGAKGRIVNKHNPDSVLYGTVGDMLNRSDFGFRIDEHGAPNAFYKQDWDFYQEQTLPDVPGSVVVLRDPSVFFHLSAHGLWISDNCGSVAPRDMAKNDWVLIYDNKKEAA
jgi:hypothetical protein